MSASVLVLVRIAVLVPNAAVPGISESDTPSCPNCPCADVNTVGAEPVAPQVTAEMVAFYREHPNDN